MSEKNLTIWQRLSKTLGPNSLLNQDYPTYKFDKKELLRTKDKQEYEKEKLQAQQSFYIGNQWQKVENNLYSQATYYEPSRLSAQYDFESMEFSLHGDTKIATPNGFISIKELADKGRDYEFITYAYDHNLKQVVPAKARNAHYTRDEMTYKITFDDGTFIIATYGHRFLKRDGVFCEVENLKDGDSMMPFYRKSFYNNQNYNWIYTCNKDLGHNGWIVEHNIIAEWHNNVKIQPNEEVHHIDFNGKNNLPENLKIMDRTEHRSFHAKIHNAKLWKNEDFRKLMSEVARKKGKYKWNGIRKADGNPSYITLKFDDIVNTAKTERTIDATAKYLNVSVKKIQNELRFNGYKNWFDFLSVHNIPRYFMQKEDYNKINFGVIPWDLIVETAKSESTIYNTSKKLGITHGKLRRCLEQGGYNKWSTFMGAYGLSTGKSGRKKPAETNLVNHKIVSIEEYGVVPVYDLTVPGYKNFATDTIFSHNTPEISAALDIYSEEATTTNEDGFILQIYSESKRIKTILADLFNNSLDINTNLAMWTRNTCKYGDNFVYLKLDPEKGIVGCQQLPTIEIERHELGVDHKISADITKENPSDKKGLHFSWKNKNMEFQSWEVAHFRLLGDDRKLPYGTCLKYDTKVDTEYGIKEIKDIQKGDLVWSFDINTETKVLSKVLDTVNSGKKICYQIHTKHNFIEASEEHKIMVFKNGQFIYKNVLDLEVNDLLVIDNVKGNSKSTPIDKSFPEENKNGWFNSVDFIPDYIDEEFARFFGFMIGDGWISNNGVYFALSEYDDLNDFYTGLLNKYSKNPVKIIEVNGRETQVMVYSKCLKTILQRMGFEGKALTKRLPDWIFYSDIKIQKAFVEGLIDADGWITQDKWSTHLNIELSNESLVRDLKTLCQKIGYKTGSVRKREPRKEVFIEGRELKSINPSYSLTFYDTLLEQTKKHDNLNRKTNNYILEPITKIIEIGEYETYDIYVENENHNFYANGIVVHNSMLEKARRIWKQLLLSEDAMLIYRTSRAPERRMFKVFVGNMNDDDVEAYVQRVANKFKREQIVDSRSGNVDMRFNQMAVDQDYFIPVRDPAAPDPISTLPGATNLSEIADIEYIQKKLLTALRVPKAFLGFEEVVGDGKNLALQDIRFARTINRIQKSMISELNKVAIIHLFILGFEDELSNFTLGLTNPSTQADLLKVDVWKEKVLLYKDLVSDPGNGIAATSSTWAKKHIFGWSDDEVKLDLQQQRIERAVGEELKATPTVITKTGIFDNIDKLYGNVTGGTSTATAPSETGEMGMETFSSPGGEPPLGEPGIPPPPGGEAPAAEAPAPELAPESRNNNLNILVENDLIEGKEVIDLSQGQKSLGKISEQLDKLINNL